MLAPLYSVDEYLQALQSLFPTGRVWPRDGDEVPAQMLRGIAQNYVRSNARANQLLVEAFPATAYELLPEWEASLGLPSACTGQLSTVQARRDAVVSALSNTGGQSIPYFISVALKLGYSISITGFRPYAVNSAVNTPLYGRSWAYAWQVNGQLNTVRKYTVNSPVNQAFGAWGNTLLECVISKLQPAHGRVLFAYT